MSSDTSDSPDSVVHFDLSAGIARITLDSQANRNALSQRLVREVHAALDAAEQADARAIVLTHLGPAFCAGADLSERRAGPPDSSGFVRLLARLMDTERPTIAAVTGAVRAGGIGLMASCDLVVIHPDVNFALTEVRIGVAPAIISVPILRRVSPGRIAAAMLTGEAFSAAQALDIGLVTHVTNEVDSTVDSLCAGIRAGSPRAVAETKKMLHTVPQMDRDRGFAQMQALSDMLFQSPEAQEGMAAFKEKRAPQWAQSGQD